VKSDWRISNKRFFRSFRDDDSLEAPDSLETDVSTVLKAVAKEQLRKMVSEESVRIDGRKMRRDPSNIV